MKIVKNRNNKKIFLILGMIILIGAIICGSIFYFVINKKSDSSTQSTDAINYAPPSEEEVKAGQDIKQTEAPDSSTPKSPNSDAPSPDTPTSSTTVTITAANQNGPVLQVRALVAKVSNTGTCTIKLIRGSSVGYTASAETQALANSSACKGFDIPLSGIAKGVWTLQVEFNEGAAKGSISQEVTIS